MSPAEQQRVGTMRASLHSLGVLVLHLKGRQREGGRERGVPQGPLTNPGPGGFGGHDCLGRRGRCGARSLFGELLRWHVKLNM